MIAGMSRRAGHVRLEMHCKIRDWFDAQPLNHIFFKDIQDPIVIARIKAPWQSIRMDGTDLGVIASLRGNPKYLSLRA